MQTHKVYTALGLMSGTSLDGIDVAVIRTDGHRVVEPVAFHARAYTPQTKEMIRGCLLEAGRHTPKCQAAETQITREHIDAVHELLRAENMSADEIDIIGFHGQTIIHDPQKGWTVQLGCGETLARETGIDTVHDFRTADMQAGGQGAPLLPLYHRARAVANNLRSPLAIVNIGGVANVTYINDEDILAFDTGAGCALIDDLVRARTGKSYDENGALASSGTPNQDVLSDVMALPFFDARPPKSLDRETFKKPDALRGAGLFQTLDTFSTEDGVATLSEFTVQGIARSMDHMPHAPKSWLITGGGRLNDYIMTRLRDVLDCDVQAVETAGWNGDAVEAEGFGYLAVRSVLGLSLSLPTTTGARESVTGGVFNDAGKTHKQAI